MLEMIAAGNNPILVPLTAFDHRLQVLARANKTVLFLDSSGIESDFFTSFRNNPSATLFVENPAMIFPGLHISLVTGDTKSTKILTAVLNPAIAASNPVGKRKFEVINGSLLPD